jgi:DNA-binding NarL/FixJ family response regulator
MMDKNKCGHVTIWFQQGIGFTGDFAMIRVIIVEDDPAVVERLRNIIEPADDIEVVATAVDVESGRGLIRSVDYDVMLCDLGLPGGSGIDLIRFSSQTNPKSDIIVVTVFANQSRVLDSIKAGAKGYLLKDDQLDHCAEHIREIRRGGSPISPMIARQLLKQMLPPEETVVQPLKEGLSAREAEVLNLLARGFSYLEIAALLGLTSGTVGTYVKRIYKKLEVNSRAEAVFEAGNRGIIHVH